MKKIKVLFVHQDGVISGSAISLKYLLQGLDRSKFEIKVLLASDGPAKALFESIGLGVEVLRIRGLWTAPGPKWYRRGAFLNLLALLPNRKLESYLQRNNPDIIHLNDKALAGINAIAKKLRIPVIQHLRSTYQATSTPFFISLSKRLIKRNATFLVGISEDETEEFSDFPRRSVMFNSMDFDGIENHISKRLEIRKEFKAREADIVVTFVGMFSKTKGAWDFLDMVEILNRDHPEIPWKFILIAKLPQKSKRKGILKLLDLGSERSSEILKKKLSNENIKKNLIMTDYRTDILDVFGASDVAVICNRLGATGRQAFECMSVGTPLVITSGHTGKSSIVKNGETALVVEPANPSALGKAVMQLVLNHDLRRELRTNARRFAKENFDYKKNSRITEDLYAKIISEKSAG